MPHLSPTWAEFVSITLAVLGITLAGVKVMLSNSEKVTTEKLGALFRDVETLGTHIRNHKHICEDGTFTKGVVFDR